MFFQFTYCDYKYSKSKSTKSLRIYMLFVSKTLQYSFCACVRNLHKIVIFVIEKMKLVSFSLLLDASPPRPKMPLGQSNVIMLKYNMRKGRLGSRGGGGGKKLYKRKKTSII